MINFSCLGLLKAEFNLIFEKPKRKTHGSFSMFRNNWILQEWKNCILLLSSKGITYANYTEGGTYMILGGLGPK